MATEARRATDTVVTEIAPSKNKITKEERAVLTNGLDMLYTSLMRSAKSAKAASLRDAFEIEARKVETLSNRLNSGELEL